MSGYEPSSGWNLPPGCFESDPRAPWNRPDPWEGRTLPKGGDRCRWCGHLFEDFTYRKVGPSAKEGAR